MVRLRLGPAPDGPRGPAATWRTRILGSLFFGLFLGMGLLFLLLLVRDLREDLDTHRWTESTATIVRSEVVRGSGEKPYVPTVAFEYVWRGQTHRGDRLAPEVTGYGGYAEAARRLDPYAVGARVPCRVAADGRAVLEPASPWRVLFVLLPLLFVAIGGGGIVVLWRPQRRDARGRPIEPPISSTARRRIGARVSLVVGGLLVAVGAGLAWPMAVSPALSVWQARDWARERCTIEHSNVVRHADDDGDTYSVDILYRFERDGHTHRSSRYGFFGGSSSGRDGKEAIVRAHPVGSTTTCFVDPADPREAVIERGLTALAFLGLLPLAFVVVGLLVARQGWRRSTYRDRLASGAVYAARGPAADDPVLEWLPEYSPTGGTTVLPSRTTRLGRLFGVVFACAFWNGIVAVFVHQALGAFDEGRPDWGLTCFLVPFVLVGAVLVLGIFYELMRLANARPHLETSQAAPTLGESVEVGWRLDGRLAGLRRLTLTLEGVEEATYQRGTNSYTATETFHSVVLADHTTPSPMGNGRVSFAIPADSMHSFDGGHNRIVWRLRLVGAIHRWPDIDEHYPLVVLPRPTGDLRKPGRDDGSDHAGPSRRGAGEERPR